MSVNNDTSQALNKSYGKNAFGRDVARQVVPDAGSSDRKSSVV